MSAMGLRVAFLVVVAVAAVGVYCQQDESILFQTRGGTLNFRVGCKETVTCVGKGNDAYWTHNLFRVENSTDLTISPRRDFQLMDGTSAFSVDMTFNPVRESRAGTYTCLVTTGGSPISHEFMINVASEPLEIVSATPSQDISSHKVGENFTIECNVGTCYTDLAVSFFKGGDVLKTIRTAKNIGLYQHTFTLDKNSAGVYGCKVDTAEKALFPRMFTLTGIPTTT